MKTESIQLIAGLAMFVLCISVCTTTSNAAVVWSDDFETGLDDWTLFGYESRTSTVTIEGNFSDTGGVMTVLDDDINVARHDSTVNTGTWSFDIFVQDDGEGYLYLLFMSNGAIPASAGPSTFVCVGVWMTEGKFIVWQRVESSNAVRNIYVDTLQGWHHIEVGRTSGGRFLVSFNGTLKDDFVSNDVTTSTYLEVFCGNATGCAIDNLVVDDEPPDLPPPSWELIAIGGGVAVVAIVSAVVFLRRR
ncbi:MAG: hypothetical protein ACXADC_16815 [Candidatus Thorarchaeota archaeon]|jgi:hypothetical protein